MNASVIPGSAAPGGAVALVVVDMQRDYLERPGLHPDAATLVAAVARLVDAFRRTGAPVAHVHTVVPPDGAGALPHWRRLGRLWCVEGTSGAQPPIEVAPVSGEFTARKTHYSGFADPGLERWLAAAGVTTVAVVGLMEHGCVRATALDAAAAGFDVAVVADAVATDDVAHSEASRRWIDARVASMVTTADLIARLGPDGARHDTRHATWHDTPHDTPHTTAEQTAERPDVVAAHAAAAATVAQQAWAGVPPRERAAVVERWADLMAERADDMARAISSDVHKPITQARDEVRRAVAHLRAAASLADLLDDTIVGADVRVRRRPVGVVGLVMPWNNPLALPAGKAASALVVGNGVVLKPAPQAVAATAALLASAVDAGVPADLLQVVHGGPAAAMAVASAPDVGAVAVTGSIATGRRLAAVCTQLSRPLQAELGGNNAAVVLADADLAREVPALVAGAFAFSGQRCTAIRRVVVERSALQPFLAATVAAMDSLRIGDPSDPATQVGPLISPDAAARVEAVVDRAVADGAEIVHRADLDPRHTADDRGWVPPTLLLADDPTVAVVQQETFGPVLVVQPADDLSHAVALANGVEQGLLGAVCTVDPDLRRQVADALSVGIVQIGGAPPPIDAEAPFGGWGASGIGPPEHGVWDLDLLTRVQAVYGG